jgi:hypothetical protein
MSQLSDNRISALARLSLNVLAAEGKVANQRVALNESKRVLAEHFQIDDKIDVFVRQKIASLSRQVVPGSGEWDVLYRRYFEEERRKRKF